MASFAELDANKRVLRVVVCASLEWLQQRLGGTWVATSDVDPAKQYAGPGMYGTATIAPRQFVPAWTQPTQTHYIGSNGTYHFAGKGRRYAVLATASALTAPQLATLIAWAEEGRA